MSFLEMLDVVNEDLIGRGQEPIAFDSDCREGICGMCSLVINGIPHGGHKGTTTCQLHLRHFKDGDTITIEPWRARAFPIDQRPGRGPQRVRPHHSGGRIRLREHRRRARRQRHPGAEETRRTWPWTPRRASAAARASRPARTPPPCSSSPPRFRTSIYLPQGKAEKDRRALNMVRQMDAEGFGNCTVTGSCEAVCPKEISLNFIAKMNRDYGVASVKGK